MEEVQKFLKECGVYYLATVDGDKPKVRPFGTAEIFENHLYIQTGKKKDVYKQIEKNNNDLRGMYDENDDNTAVLYFESGKATISSFTEAPVVIEF